MGHERERRNRKKQRGIPWRSSGQDSALSLPRARDQSLVGELRSHEPQGVEKKKKKGKEKEKEKKKKKEAEMREAIQTLKDRRASNSVQQSQYQ